MNRMNTARFNAKFQDLPEREKEQYEKAVGHVALYTIRQCLNDTVKSAF